MAAAIWTAVKNWVHGNVVTEADMDTYVSENIRYLHEQRRERNQLQTAARIDDSVTEMYIPGSHIKVPAGSNGYGQIKQGTVFYWRLNWRKPASGTGANTFTLRIGINGTNNDTAVLSLVVPGGTAAADEGIVTIVAMSRTDNAPGVPITVVAELVLVHIGNTTGLTTTPNVVLNTVDTNNGPFSGNNFVGLTFNADVTGHTFEVLQAEGWGIHD